jgi:hypothetical protein
MIPSIFSRTHHYGFDEKTLNELRANILYMVHFHRKCNWQGSSTRYGIQNNHQNRHIDTQQHKQETFQHVFIDGNKKVIRHRCHINKRENKTIKCENIRQTSYDELKKVQDIKSKKLFIGYKGMRLLI